MTLGFQPGTLCSCRCSGGGLPSIRVILGGRTESLYLGLQLGLRSERLHKEASLSGWSWRFCRVAAAELGLVPYARYAGLEALFL